MRVPLGIEITDPQKLTPQWDLKFRGCTHQLVPALIPPQGPFTSFHSIMSHSYNTQVYTSCTHLLSPLCILGSGMPDKIKDHRSASIQTPCRKWGETWADSISNLGHDCHVPSRQVPAKSAGKVRCKHWDSVTHTPPLPTGEVQCKHGLQDCITQASSPAGTEPPLPYRQVLALLNERQSISASRSLGQNGQNPWSLRALKDTALSWTPFLRDVLGTGTVADGEQQCIRTPLITCLLWRQECLGQAVWHRGKKPPPVTLASHMSSSSRPGYSTFDPVPG